MPIRKNQDNHIEAEFGSGDLLVSAAMNPETGIHNTVFIEDLETEHGLIGVQHHDKNGRKNSEIKEGSIRLTFNKAASVSVLINYLSIIRNSLLENESISA